jgi:hypothetical protein
MIMRRTILAAFIAAALPASLAAQATQTQIEILRLIGVPHTAVSPLSLPMPASRNHSYLIGRLQTGYRKGPGGSAMPAVTGGIDLQYRGGSILGLSGGWQKRDCGLTEGCGGGHAMFGARTQINLVTGGTMFANILRDNTATSTLGLEMNFGYAPKVIDKINACSLDVGVPFSVAKRRQRPRIVAYVSPGMLWDFSCGGDSGPPTRKSYRTDFGFALQQVGNRSFDVYFGMQKLWRRNVGFQTGLRHVAPFAYCVFA